MTLELKFNDIKQMIINYCQSEGYNRVYSKDNAITYKFVERTGFDEEEVRALLEPEGLWQKVIGFDPSLVRELLADKGLDRDIKDSLQKLKRVTSRYPQLTVKKLAEEE